jgi:uncharacterized protein YjbI with pentapeptide repeats
MANPDHVARLKDSLLKWNSWRRSNPSILPELSGADLSEADLGKAYLTGANLSGAVLSKANLIGAYLTSANLSEVNLIGAYLNGAVLILTELRGANLSGAILIGTNLSKAILNEANLNGAFFRGAKLSKADLRKANLSGADLKGAYLNGANLSGADLNVAYLNGADLNGANLREANLRNAHLSGADLRKADLSRASLIGADLTGADLSEASLIGAYLTRTNLSEANLSGAHLNAAVLILTELRGANLTGSFVYGLSAWDVQLEGSIQSNLVITPEGVPAITVDNLEIAQFIYLLLNNKNVRHVIDTITSKVVLILGRFTPDRKPVLDAIREELRTRDYLPVLFDFEGPSNRDITETVSTLAHMARFVIADITDAKSIPQELKAIVPNLPSVPVQPLLLASQQEYGMFEHISRYPWVLEPILYEDQDGLLAVLTEKVIGPAEMKAKEQTGR